MSKYTMIFEERCVYRVEVEASSEKEAKKKACNTIDTSKDKVYYSGMRAKVLATDDTSCENFKWFAVS